jgi:Ca2+-transporting ATPase
MANFWEMDKSDVLTALEVKSDAGLNTLEVEKRLKLYGANKIDIGKKTSAWLILFRQFKSPIVYLLVIAIFISFILAEYIEGFSILIILLLNAIIGFFQEYKAESALLKLSEMTSPHGRVRRDSKVIQISSGEIVPGDILFLEAGDYVVADARLIEVNELSVDEAILTGESLPVAKNTAILAADKVLAERFNMIFAGTAVARGSGLAVVTATAEKTEMGEIANLLKRKEKTQTPIQKRLEILGHYLLFASIIIIVLIFIIGFVEKRDFQDILMSALSLSIAVIPEGLPAMVTVALLVAVFRMSKKGALIRRLDAVETLGATDVICTDKTGTLTYGKMEVDNVYTNNQDNKFFTLLNMFLCNNASLSQNGSGDSTEIALLRYVSKEKFDKSLCQLNKLREWPFDSDRKRMSVAVQDSQGSIFILTKGAPESVFPQCREGLNTEAQSFLEQETKSGKRLLAYGYKKLSNEEFSNLKDQSPENNLIFTGLSALSDQLREESRTAIAKSIAAGIKVIMITGDHPATALSIAKDLKIGSGSEDEVLTGKELESIDDEYFSLIIDKVFVYARVTSEQKYRIVSALLKKGHVVSMTGDGVNDAPALKKASVGVAMGKAGTEVARQASSMVLTNDDFATIVFAIEEGRGIFSNLKRTLQYLLSTNLAELLLIFFSIFLGLPVPLLPINILWINLVTDGLPALALASERIPSNYLEESIRPSTKNFFDKGFHQELLIVAFAITLFGIGIYYFSIQIFNLEIARSFVFSFMVYAILFRSFSCRAEKKTFWQLKMNWTHLVSVMIPLFFQVLFQYSYFLRNIFKVELISFKYHFILLGIALIPLSIIEFYKFWFIQRKTG